MKQERLPEGWVGCSYEVGVSIGPDRCDRRCLKISWTEYDVCRGMVASPGMTAINIVAHCTELYSTEAAARCSLICLFVATCHVANARKATRELLLRGFRFI